MLLFVLGYSLAKRFTSLAHFWLGASLMLAPVAAWIAVKGLADMTVPLILGAAVAFWVAGFDILYACQDADVRPAERAAQRPGAVRRAGQPADRCRVPCRDVRPARGGLYFASPHLGDGYLAGLGGRRRAAVYEHRLVRPDDLTRVNRAFFHVNGIISVGLLVLVLVQLAVR